MINFGLIFGMSGYKFSSQSIIPEWKREQVDTFFNENIDVLQETYDRCLKTLNEKSGKDTIFEGVQDKQYTAKCWSIAILLRGKFFESYPTLLEWTERQPAIAKELGFVESPFGAVRRLPQLKDHGKDDQSLEVKNLCNISINSPVQNVEISIMTLLMIHLHTLTKERSMKSRFALTVHDSVVFYIHKDEVNEIAYECKKYFEQDWKEMLGVRIKIEGEMADYFGKGEVWGEGDEINFKALFAITNRI